MNLPHIGHASPQVLLETWMARTILRCRPKTNTIMERRLESIILFPRHVRMLIEHDATDDLASAARHHARLAFSHLKALVDEKRGRPQPKACQPSPELSITRKNQIVGIPRVVRIKPGGEAAEPAIELPAAQIRQRGRCRHAL